MVVGLGSDVGVTTGVSAARAQRLALRTRRMPEPLETDRFVLVRASGGPGYEQGSQDAVDAQTVEQRTIVRTPLMRPPQ